MPRNCQSDEEKLKEIELRYRTLLDQTNDAVFIIGLDNKIKEVNRQATELFGYSQEEFLTFDAFDIIDPNEVAKAKKRKKELLAKKKLPLYYRKFRKKDGSLFIGEINVHLVCDENGKPLYIQSIVRDATEQIKNQEELKQQKEEIQLYLDILTHDLRNYHMFIDGYLDLALKKIKSSPTRNYLRKARAGTTKATTLINNISILLKQQLSLDYNLYPVSILDMVERTTEIIKIMYFNKKIKFEIVDINDTDIIIADSLVEQLLINLLTNAVKNDPHDLIVIELGIAERTEEYLVFYVSDHGKGIPPNQRKKIFNRFSTFRRKGKGSGLGLFIIKTLVSRYDAEIRVESRVKSDWKKGTTFKIKFRRI